MFSNAAPQPAEEVKVLKHAVCLLEEDHSLPLVDFTLVFQSGSLGDPEGLEGTTRLLSRLIRMGSKRLSPLESEEAISGLGGRLGIETAPDHMRFHGSVLARNLDPYLALVAELIKTPALRAKDLSLSKRETLSDLSQIPDDDRGLAARNLRRLIFGHHIYARPIAGTHKSLRRITRKAIQERHREVLTQKGAIFGAAGAVSMPEFRELIERHFGDLPSHAPRKIRHPATKMKKGRRVLLIDKPDRSQVQMYIGGLGIRTTDPELYPLLVASAAFGGTFTSRLMQEVRVKRGWSYGVYCHVGHARQREAWHISSQPSSEYAADCLALELGLLEDLQARGLSSKEIRFAKDYLRKSYCFELDTASKRLDAQVDVRLRELPKETYRDHERRIGRVTVKAANESLEALSPKNLAIVLVASAGEIEPALRKLPGIDALEVVPYQKTPSSVWPPAP